MDQNGVERKSADYEGARLALYFYPKAFTPGCTTEACDFRDRYELFLESSVQILGVSPDPPEKLAKFRDEHHLPFDLLSDPDHEIATAYGAYGLKKNYGREYLGIIRSTFLIDDAGVIEEAYYNVRAKGHAERIRKAVNPR
jgi:peroxiredoxin Q/BCP